MKKFYIALMLLSAGLSAQINNPAQPGTPDYLLTVPTNPKATSNANVNNGNGLIATSYTLTKCGLNFTYASNPLYKRPFSFQVGVTQPAAFTISGLPTCVVIEKAFLYAGMSGNGIAVTATITNPASATNSFPMTIIGQDADKCWSYAGSYSYRADVTSIISGNGNYMISGLPTNPPIAGNDTDGALLFIVYTDQQQTYSGSIVIADGCQTKPPGPVTSTITGFNVCGAVTSYTNFLMVSDLQKIANTNINLNSATNNYVLTTAQQQVWNFIVDPGAAPVVAQTSAIYNVGPNGSDCYDMTMAGMYFRTNCLSCSPSSNTLCLLSPANSSTFICRGAVTTVSISNPNNLANPSYSIQPAGQIQSNPNFTVSPTSSTTYTLYITGTTSTSAVITQSSVATVSVYPTANMNPLVTNGTCATPVTSSVNLNVTFSPSGSPNYTTTWSPLPGTVTTVNSPTASGLVPGLNSVTLTTSDGCKTIATFSVLPIPQPASFVIVNPSGDYTITCLNPNVLLTASVTNGVPLSYTWFPTCTGTLVGASMNFTQACTGQVVGTSSTGCQFVQTFTVYQNYASPTIAITPTVQNITCAAGSGCFTLTSNMGPNVTTNWFQVVGTTTIYVGAAQGTINIFCPGSPGDYWGESVNNLTGCKSTKSVQVTASIGVPIFTVTSPTNFTIGCGSKSITSMQVTTVITSPVPNTPVSYTFMVPPVTGTPTTFTINPNLNNITIPGTYVIYVKDLTNNCVSSQSISIIQNTIAPNIDFIQPLSILSCREPSMVLNGISSNPNTQITWTVPAIPSNSINPTPNHTVVINPAITGATNNITSVGIFTVGAVDQNNMCRSTKTVQILQDIRIPKFTISALTNSVITCKNLDVVIVPIITPTLAVALVPTYIWYPPVGPGVPGSQFNSTAAGSHTSISTSVVNGCTASATYIIASDQTPPALGATGLFTLDCANNPTSSITPSITGSTTGFTYSWTVPPGALTSALTGSALTTNITGLYFVMVTNTINGCVSIGSYEVIPGAINASFTAIPDHGFVPLSVTFNNNSSTSAGASSIISTWGYGNGAVTQTVYNTQPTSASYTASGTYSVILIVRKGSCIDTAMRLIYVELASKLEIPNVFTPNGDKSNDIFRLRASSLNEIYIIIYDRWGNKVYELTSDTGNFAWDGKSQYGKDCSEGTYFYIIKATGKDGQEYDLKGNVSLFR
ncbi:MAG: gliding motility-associated C-terminal domain-containing protein [Bacteroidia bacterium]|nr:gliding motility-associated C-terminal domain-containing protein [Bacteroidia bacterium]